MTKRPWILGMAAAALATCLLAGSAHALQWLPWEPLPDGHQNRIYLRGNEPVDTLSSTQYQLRNGYSRRVRVELLVVEQGDAPAAPDSPRYLVRATLRPGQIAAFRTSGGAGVYFHRIAFP